MGMKRTDGKSALDAVEARLRASFRDGLAGDGRAYRAFLGMLASHLRQFLRRRLRSRPDDVEDLVQECLIAVHDKRHTYDVAQPVTPWLHAIARYKLTDHLRRARVEIASDDLDAEIDLLAEAAQDAADARRDVAKLLAQLPPRQRLPIFHVKLEGLTVAQTATMTGMSASAVKVGIHRGLKALGALIRTER
jgi:RNA polymerase sigma factor (sigma-70 family)